VVEAAKKTGDYAVLSHADLCVLALTYALDSSEKAAAEKTAERVRMVSVLFERVEDAFTQD
jgi:rRNA maturation endonuclease Nob1